MYAKAPFLSLSFPPVLTSTAFLSISKKIGQLSGKGNVAFLSWPCMSYLVHRSTFCRRLPPGQGVPLCLTSSTFYRGSSHSSRRCHFRSCWRRFRLDSWTGRTRVTRWEGGAGRGQRRRQRRRNWKGRRELRNKNKNLVTLKCNITGWPEELSRDGVGSI